MKKHMDEQALLALLKSNKERAIEEMFKAYYPFLCNVVGRMTNDRVLAEDIAQEVFLDLWRKKDRLEIKISLPAYLKRSVVNKTLNHIRAKKMKFDDMDGVDIVESSAKVDLQMEGEEMKEQIHSAIQKLPEKCRLVFTLSRYEEMSYQEIADQLQISKKTVENQISKALKVLREALIPV